MKHEIIKNGVAGVEINGRFYTHKKGEFLCRLIDADAWKGKHSYCAILRIYRDGESVLQALTSDLIPIPNPALEWPAGTKVMVRNCDNTKWLEAVLNEVFDDRVSATIIGLDFNLSRCWKQCKLAEGGE